MFSRTANGAPKADGHQPGSQGRRKSIEFEDDACGILHNLLEPLSLVRHFGEHPPEGFVSLDLGVPAFSARFDLLFHDQANFRADLAAADMWLKKYFDTRAKPVQSLQTLLKELRATDMSTELPGLAGSLDAVRVLQLAREKRMR